MRLLGLYLCHLDGNLKGMVEECKIENIQGKVIKIIKANKEIDCNNKQNRSLAQLWFSLLPIRRYLLGIYRRVM